MTLRAHFILSCLLLFVLSCTSPTKDFDIHINPTFFKYVVEVELSDFNNPTTIFSDPVNIELIGQDATGIYNIDGTKNFDINFGTLQLLVARDFEPTNGSPLNFRINITSNSYKDVSIPIEILESDYYIKRDVDMLDLSNLPTGISSSSNSGTIGSNGQLNQAVVINTGSADSLSNITLTIPSGVNFKDANGNTINGSQLNTNILSLSDTSSAGQSALPNGGGQIQTIVANGEVLDIFLEPSATFEINMDVDGQAIKSFTGSGINMIVDIPDIMYNEDAGRAYQAGDSVSLISFSEGDAGWKDDDTYLVQSDGQGNLFVDMNVQHLSYFKILGTPLSQKQSNYITFSISVKTSPAISNPVSGQLVLDLNFNHGNRTSKMSFRASKTFTSNPIKVLTMGFGANSGTVSATERGTFTLSAYDITITEDKPGEVIVEIAPKNLGVNVSFSLYCAGNNAVVNPPPGVKMFYRENGSGAAYTHLYTFTQDNITTNSATIYELEDGTSYDFRALFNSHQVDTLNVLVEDGKHYQVTLPKSACDEIF